MRKPDTHEYNFDPYLAKIISPNDVDMARLHSFTPPSKDAVRPFSEFCFLLIDSPPPHPHKKDPHQAGRPAREKVCRVDVVRWIDACAVLLSRFKVSRSPTAERFVRLPERGTPTRRLPDPN